MNDSRNHSALFRCPWNRDPWIFPIGVGAPKVVRDLEPSGTFWFESISAAQRDIGRGIPRTLGRDHLHRVDQWLMRNHADVEPVATTLG